MSFHAAFRTRVIALATTLATAVAMTLVPTASAVPETPGVLLDQFSSRIVGQDLGGDEYQTTVFDYSTQYQDTITDQWTPLSARATLVKSDKPWDGELGRPVVAIAPNTLGAADYCDNSESSQQLLDLHLSEKDLAVNYELFSIWAMITKGIDVVVIDYPKTPEGLQLYVNNFTSGRALLDAVRAAQDLGVDKDAPVGLWGHSQGGGAAGAAVEIAPGYAPELNMKAASLGAIPSDLPAVLTHVDGGFLTGVIAYAAMALLEVHPELKDQFWDKLSEKGQYELTEGNNKCLVGTVLESGRADTTEWTTTGQTISELLNSIPEIDRILQNHRLGSVAPQVPVNVYSSSQDDVIPYDQVTQLADVWSGKGADVKFETLDYPQVPFRAGINHATPYLLGIPDHLDWLMTYLR